MKNVFDLASQCLQDDDIEKKLTTTAKAWQLLQQQQLDFKCQKKPDSIENTRFPKKPILLKPQKMPKRSFNTLDGVKAFFHAIAHIEFMAIYLAWDIVYRFQGLPEQFYKDWLKVAAEEAEHFALIRRHLQSLGCDYGNFPAHQGLWEHAVDTQDDILARLAIIPRCMEARGLDVTPPMIEKFKKLKDTDSVKLLERILEDEIGHVALGSFWFKTLSKQQGFEPEIKYQQLLQQYYKGKPKGPFNKEMRIMAGFSTDEINWLENL